MQDNQQCWQYMVSVQHEIETHQQCVHVSMLWLCVRPFVTTCMFYQNGRLYHQKIITEW